MDEQLTRAIEAWKESDTAIHDAMLALRQLRTTRDALQDDVVSALEQAGHGTAAVIRLNHTKFRVCETKQTSPLTLVCVRASLERCIDDPDTVNAIMNVIKEDRSVKTKTVIRYTPGK